MVAATLERQRQREQVSRLHAEGFYVSYDRTAFGYGAGLIHDDRVYVVQILKRLGGLEQHAVFRADTRADHDRDRRSQSQCARARDNEHRDSARERKARRFTGQQPDDCRHECNTHNDRHEHARNLIGQLGNRRLGRACLLYQTDDLAQGRIVTDTRGFHDNIAALGHSCTDHGIADTLFDRHALAGDGAFIQISAALGNLAVNRHGLTAAHDNEVANLYLLNRQLHGLTATDNLGGLRTQVHQRRNGFAGLALGTRFKELAERYQRQNHACGFKIQVVHKAVGCLRRGRERNLNQRVNAVHERRTRANDDKRVHRRGTMQQRFEAVDIIFAIDNDNRQREDQLRECQIEHAVHACRIGRQRQPDHLAHREVHQDKHENRRNDNTGLHFLQRLVRLRALRRSRCLPAVVHRSRVAAGLDRLYNRLCVARVFIVLDRHAAGEQIYLHAADTRHRRNAFLHMGGAGRAAHAAHPKPLFHIASPIYTPPPREGVLIYRHSIHPGNSLVNNKVSLDEHP